MKTKRETYYYSKYYERKASLINESTERPEIIETYVKNRKIKYIYMKNGRQTHCPLCIYATLNNCSMRAHIKKFHPESNINVSIRTPKIT